APDICLTIIHFSISPATRALWKTGYLEGSAIRTSGCSPRYTEFRTRLATLRLPKQTARHQAAFFAGSSARSQTVSALHLGQRVSVCPLSNVTSKSQHSELYSP